MATIATRGSRQAAWLFVFVALHVASPSAQRTVGIIADDSFASDGGPVFVFDADTDTIIGTLFLPKHISGFFVFADAVIAPNEFKGFVTETTGKVWIIDLSASTPSLAAGINPILISGVGTDIALTPDGRFIIATDGNLDPPQNPARPVSVVDISTRLETNTLQLGFSQNAVDVCANNSVLVTAFNANTVRRLVVDGSGTLTDTGELLSLVDLPHNVAPNNVVCAPGSASGVVVGGFTGYIQSFTIPGLAAVDKRLLSAIGGQTVLMSSSGERVFARSAGGAIDVFEYNAATGALGSAPLFTIPIVPFTGLTNDVEINFGQDFMALHPNGNKLYVSEPNAVRVFDAHTGALLTSILDPNLKRPQGLAVATLPNRPPTCTTATVSPSSLWPADHGLVPLGNITGVSDPDSDPVTITVNDIFQDEAVDTPGEGAGNTAPDANLTPLAVRAERNGTGNGRVYHIVFAADDGHGGSCTGTAKVCVPHDHAPGGSCVDEGPLFNAIP